MSPKNSRSKNFVGRESELKELSKLKPYGKVRVLFISGSGGIGKTKLLEAMLSEISKKVVYSPVELLDFSLTELRSIDGIQTKVIEVIEKLTGLQGKKSPFAEFYKENQDTSEQFNKCLRKFCKATSLALAFDTFELLGNVTKNWFFSEESGGFQVPGLICVVAGRPGTGLVSKKIVKNIKLLGLSVKEIEELFQRHSLETSQASFTYSVGNESEQESLQEILRITEGHPLRIEMALNWAPALGKTSSKNVQTPQEFESNMMRLVCERGEKGDLNVSFMVISQAVFDTLACMGMITRRFDEGILKYLIDEGYIRYGNKKNIRKDILVPLEKYFFVKTRNGDYGEQIYQLHDEMARLVQEHVWTYRDTPEIERKTLLESILKYYDQKIESIKAEVHRTNQKIGKIKDIDQKRNLEIQNLKKEDFWKNLQIERLYYTFRIDFFSNPIADDGRRLWYKLADLDDDYLNSYLPSEIKEFKDFYPPNIKYEIHERIAQIEYDAGHVTQAKKEWEQVYQLGQAENRNDWITIALFSLAYCERDLSVALKKFVKAKRFCENHARDYLSRVNYNIGLTYRKLQNVDKAIEWYKKARKEFKKNSKNKILGAQIANDLGYAYSHVGEWEESRKNIKEGQKTRKDIKLQFEREVAALESKLKLSTGKIAHAELRDKLTHTKNRLSKARFHLALSHNTLGEIYRYEEDLDASLRNYNTAYALFEMEKYYKWQAKSLFSRGETYRRIALTRHYDGDEAEYQENLVKAEADIKESLYLCEKYRIKEERDTASRRMGRVLHDRAIHALESGNRKEALKLLDRAWHSFTEGLKFAKETGDDLEILSNQTELAFLYDDFVRAMGRSRVPKEYWDALKDLKRILVEHRKKPFRIYQFEVFENEYKLEEAAAAYQANKYGVALKKYIEGYVGLAADPGYGRTRYKSLFQHLARQIERLPQQDAEKWCWAFIRAWETPQVVGNRKFTLDHETIFPDMVQWCCAYLEKI